MKIGLDGLGWRYLGYSLPAAARQQRPKRPGAGDCQLHGGNPNETARVSYAGCLAHNRRRRRFRPAHPAPAVIAEQRTIALVDLKISAATTGHYRLVDALTGEIAGGPGRQGADRGSADPVRG